MLTTATDWVDAPLVHKGKVRELYDLQDSYLIVVSDRISAFDYVLEPAVPGKGALLNQLSRFWFEKTAHLQANHLIHTDVSLLSSVIRDPARLEGRVMVVRKARRIDIECVVRGYITGSAWREYAQSSTVNAQPMPPGLRKNQRLETPIFTPAVKNDTGHDENISLSTLEAKLGSTLARQLQDASVRLYDFAHRYCSARGVILADSKFEFGFAVDEAARSGLESAEPNEMNAARAGEGLMLIDELFTPDSSRFWATDKYALDTEIDSMDKEPVRSYLAQSGWDKQSAPEPLPSQVIEATARRYAEIHRLLTQ